jgi:hypothetical protein
MVLSLAISFYNMSLPKAVPEQDLPRSTFVRAILDFKPSPDQPAALSFSKGAVFNVWEYTSDPNWHLGYNAKFEDGRPGLIPVECVEECKETANWSRL